MRAQEFITEQGMAENKAAGINKMFNNLGDPVYANLQRVALLAMQGRQSEAAGRLQTVIKHADPAVQKKIIDAVNSIKPVTINGRVADSSTLDKSKQHNDWITNTFIPWVQSLLGQQGVAEGKQPGQPVVDAILKVMPIAQEIWFHGSRATGKHRKNSDTDILVVVPDDLVGDQYLGVVRILQKLSRHFDNYDIQPTHPGYNIHLIAQEEGQLLWSNKQDMAEDESNDTAISLSKLGKFHPGTDTLAEFVPERATAQYALHPDKWESTFYSLTNKDSDKLKYYGPKKITIPPGTLVGDMAIANKFYSAKTPDEQEQYAELYKQSLKPYPVDVSEYRMPELLIPKQDMAEGTDQINEYRDRMYQYLKSIVPTWPDYIVKDWLYANFARGATQTPNWSFEATGKDIPIMLKDMGLSVDTKWQLVPDMKFTMNMWEPKTLKRLQARAGGNSKSADPDVHIPARDAERHATQAALAQQQGGVRKEPVIIIKTSQGYELLEGWHRTIQHFAMYPNGYTGPAYVAVASAVQENFADGKNPGRKGLAKRSGVNTKASVSSLRKTAKNSSGEKQRMAHWLANMKAGRAKAKRK